MIQQDIENICPLEWRYGSPEIKKLFTTTTLIKKYIQVEKAILISLTEIELAPKKCIEIIEKCSENITPNEIYTLEKKLGHDIAALTYTLSEKCGECGKYIHLGATSYDIIDTTWALILKDAFKIITNRLKNIIIKLIEITEKHKNTIMVGRTHGQHALPITFGFKTANYVYELTRSYERLCETRKRVIRGKIGGAVGTMAAWGGKGVIVEKHTLQHLELEPHTIFTQIAPRDGFAETITNLAILASQLDRLALEIRELSRPEINEVYETTERIGSSTMPHKKNPVTAERISGLAKIIRALTITALENIPLMHERDLTNSSSERILIPHVFLIIDQMLLDTEQLLNTIYINEQAMRKNLEISRGAIMTEAIMIKLVEKNMARHIAHKKLQEITRNLSPDETIAEKIMKDKELSKYFTEEEIKQITTNYENYLGNYKELIERTINYAKTILEMC